MPDVRVPTPATAIITTVDRRYDLSAIETLMVYFVPRDRVPLRDWRARVDYYGKRIVAFHHREFGGASSLDVICAPAPLISTHSTSELREGDASDIFMRTLKEVAMSARFPQKKCHSVFRTLLVLSDITWRPFDDFHQLRLDGAGRVPVWDGLITTEHASGLRLHVVAASPAGGSRSSYRDLMIRSVDQRGVGWGIVSADGWRTPLTGTDCTVYHEGLGHLLGMVHPNGDPAEERSVMQRGQNYGWLNESWIDAASRASMGALHRQPPPSDLFTDFTAIPTDATPLPGSRVVLSLSWPPAACAVASGIVLIQTSIHGAWTEATRLSPGPPPSTVDIGVFDRPTPVSYRIIVSIANGEIVELWGYFQVRDHPLAPVIPADWSQLDPVLICPTPPALPRTSLLRVAGAAGLAHTAALAAYDEPPGWHYDVLCTCIPSAGSPWTKNAVGLLSPAEPSVPFLSEFAPAESCYSIEIDAMPVDNPKGLLLLLPAAKTAVGVVLGSSADLSDLPVPMPDVQSQLWSLENVDGLDSHSQWRAHKPSVVSRNIFVAGQQARIIIEVRTSLGRAALSIVVDHHAVLSWEGDADRLSMHPYWLPLFSDARPLRIALAVGSQWQFSRMICRPLMM